MRASTFWLGAIGVLGTSVLAVGACGDDSPAEVGGSGGSPSQGGEGGMPMGLTSTGTLVTSTGTQMNDEGIGAACDDDNDCGGMLICLTSDVDYQVFGDGGPGNGYCSALCEEDADCPNDGACFGEGDGKRCIETCIIGEPEQEFLDSPLDPEKCHGREDVRCATVNNQDICIPTCVTDDQCGQRFCDPQQAICVDEPHTGIANGEPCPDGDECEGICVTFTDDNTMCSNWCVKGGDELTLTVECGGPTVGLCAFSPAANELGDYGFCTEACTTHADCQGPNFRCFPVGGLTGNGVDNGFCFGATECPGGQADCANDDICTDTPDGPQCIDPLFPFGGEGGAGGGGGGTGGDGGAGGAGGAGGTGGT